jgi:hypothetical protein
MPRQIELTALLLAQRADMKARQDQLEIAPVQYVELAERYAARAHLVHGALIFAAPGVGEGEPVERKSERLEHHLGLARNRRAPIDHRAEHVEEQGFHRDCHEILLAWPAP